MLLKATNVKKIGWSMDVIFFMNVKITSLDLFHFGLLRIYKNILKNTMLKFLIYTAWVTKETVVCIAVLESISNLKAAIDTNG